MAISTVTFTVVGSHCASCSMLIDETLEDLPGVAASTISRKQGRTVAHSWIPTAPPPVRSPPRSPNSEYRVQILD